MKNMTDIDVLAVTMLEPEAVSIDILSLLHISTYLFCVFFICISSDSEYLGKIF